MSKKSDKLDSEALAQFRAAVADVRPLPNQQDTVHHHRPKPSPRRLQQPKQPSSSDNRFSDAVPPDDDVLADEWLFCRPGLQHGVLRKLRRGQFPLYAELDMHGLRVIEARQILTHFLDRALMEQCRVVRIIHGKGQSSQNRQPVLKGRVRHWLQQHPEVLAYCTTRPEHGGSGAIYVLLRRSRE